MARGANPTPRRDPAEESLRAITRLRGSYVRDLRAWKCRLRDADDPVVRRHIQATIRQIGQRIESLDKQARQAIEASPVLAKQMRDIQQVPGIKTVVAPMLRAELGDFGSYSRNASGGRDRGSHLAKGGSAPVAPCTWPRVRCFEAKGRCEIISSTCKPAACRRPRSPAS